MKLKIINEKTNEMYIEIEGENHTLLNMLMSILLEDERILIASYDMKHVTISEPILYIKTDGANPKEVLKDASSKLVVECDEFMNVFKAAI
ncbi:MAG: DNA-directed RNA polymerase subunit L [Methanosarcinaceae archaeon]|jgi:DNA-directed RNA polymerase subunit L|nr:DNA-directed RNA polymerase subunit L [Methanosarcinaceae archaeon]NKQ39685.1 DNA-directed RNA polymerase subunit L [Methanosarcinales archaeon]